MVWPEAPEVARIEFVAQFSRAKDLGLRESFSRKIKKLLSGSDDRRMSRPYAVAVDGDLVVVADPDAAMLHVFDTGHKTYQVLKNAGKQDFASPIGVALGGNRLFVADSELAKVFILNRRFKLLSTLDGLQRPTGLAFDPERKRLYVADTLAHQVRVFDEDGKPLFDIGARGDQDTQFNFPSHLAFANDRLFVNDTMNFRIQVLDPDGQHLRTFGKHGTGSGYFAQPKGVAIDSQGHVYVADALANRVQIFDQNGLFLLGFGGTGDGPGALQMPAGLAIWDDRIYVADSQNQRVQIFRYLREEQ
jgi:DNA-binding beta-propeller fold protein YncE